VYTYISCMKNCPITSPMWVYLFLTLVSPIASPKSRLVKRIHHVRTQQLGVENFWACTSVWICAGIDSSRTFQLTSCVGTQGWPSIVLLAAIPSWTTAVLTGWIRSDHLALNLSFLLILFKHEYILLSLHSFTQHHGGTTPYWQSILRL